MQNGKSSVEKGRWMSISLFLDVKFVYSFVQSLF